MAERAQPERVLQICTNCHTQYKAKNECMPFFCFGCVSLILTPFQPLKEKILYTSFLFRKKDCKVGGMLVGSIVREIKKEGPVRC